VDVTDQLPDRPLKTVAHIGGEAVDENNVCKFSHEKEIKNVYAVFDAKTGAGEEGGGEAINDV
jgi:hypothetical protein